MFDFSFTSFILGVVCGGAGLIAFCVILSSKNFDTNPYNKEEPINYNYTNLDL